MKASKVEVCKMFESSTEHDKSKLRGVQVRRIHRKHITRSDLAKFGYTKGCRRCTHIKVYGNCKGYHTDACRNRIIRAVDTLERFLDWFDGLDLATVGSSCASAVGTSTVVSITDASTGPEIWNLLSPREIEGGRLL